MAILIACFFGVRCSSGARSHQQTQGFQCSVVVYDSAVQQPIVSHRYIVNIIMSTALQVDLCSSIEAIPEHPGFADKRKGHTMRGIHSIDAQG